MIRSLLDERHRDRQQKIATIVGSRLGAVLRTLRDLDEAELARYAEAAYPTVLGGQKLAADAAAGYAVALAGPSRRQGRSVDVARALARSGVLITPDTRSLVAPVLRARKLVAEGEKHRDALATAAGYAAQLSSTDLQAAMRVGVGEGASASGLAVTGWRKGLSGDACEWCQDVADEVYDDPEMIPFHASDRCTAEPVLD